LKHQEKEQARLFVGVDVALVVAACANVVEGAFESLRGADIPSLARLGLQSAIRIVPFRVHCALVALLCLCLTPDVARFDKR